MDDGHENRRNKGISYNSNDHEIKTVVFIKGLRENKYNWLIKANVLFKTENDKSGDGKICEIELSAPGPRIFAKSDTDDFEKSMSKTIEDLRRQLEKRQATFSTH